MRTHKITLILLSLLLTSIFLTVQVSFPSNKLAASGDVGTQVGGTITTNTTWTVANSPYIIAETIQIPEDVTLIIEPGVTVTVQSSVNKMFLINGFIAANGNATSKIIFDGNGNSNFFETNHPVVTGFADLDYCTIRNGLSAFWFDNTGSFNLTNSELSNLSQESYLWYPSQNVFIEYNIFTNTSGIKIGTDDYYTSNTTGFVAITYNLFLNNQGYIINNFASYGLSKTYVNNNSFANTRGVIFEVEPTSTTADMNASQNYWGTADTTIVDSMIYDQNDDTACSSYINYLPLLDTPDPDTPIAPTPTPSPTPTETPSPTPTPDPTSSLTPSPTPTDTPISTSNENSSSTADISTPTSTGTPDSSSDQTSDQTPNTLNAQTIPEISPFVALLILIAGGPIGAIVLRKTKKIKQP